MNTSDWKKAAAFISEQSRPVATASTEELDSVLLSTLALNDSGPPKVTYGTHMPLAASTPNSTAPHQQDSSLSDNYQQILLRVPQGSLYPTLTAMNMEQTATVPTIICTLRNRVITNIDKYMQDAEKVHESNDNYFDAMTRSTNTSPVPDDSISKPIVLNQD